jgi:hypothetical protein
MCLLRSRQLTSSKKACSIEVLGHLFKIVKEYPTLHIDSEDYATLRIQLYRLGSNDNERLRPRHFFTPWTQSDLEKYPLDLDDEETAHDIAVRDEILANGPRSNDPLLPVRRIRIETVVAGLVSEFNRYARKDRCGGVVTPLRQMTGWKAQG